METIKNIAAITGCILSIISLYSIGTQGGRNLARKFFIKHTEDIQRIDNQQNEDIESIKKTLEILLVKFSGVERVSMQQCRNTIKNIYYRYNHEKRIPLYERKTVDVTYDIYHNILKGNSYASLLYDEICKWEIEAENYEEIQEDLCSFGCDNNTNIHYHGSLKHIASFT